MKIALYHNLPSGGAKRTVYEQVSRLAKKHEIDLYSIETANQEFADIRPFVNRTTILKFRPGRLYRSPLGRLNQGIRILDLLRLRKINQTLGEEINRGEYDIVLAHQCMFTFSPTILRTIKIPSLYYRNDPVRWLQDPKISRPYQRTRQYQDALNKIDLLNNAYKRMLRYEDNSSMKAASQVVTNSYFTREGIYRLYGVAPYVCYLGVDVEKFRPLGLGREQFVLSVGAISPYKGYDFILQGLGLIPENRRPRLVLVGNTSIPEEQAYLTSLAEALNVEVEFRQLINDEELVELYNRAMCVAYTPVMEPFGLVPIEAMSCGTAVVGIREGGVRETVIDQQTGLLVDRNPNELAEAIQSLSLHKDVAQDLGKAGREQVLKYWGWERAMEALEKQMEETILNYEA